ncbi:hypothetical protein NOVO_00425 [Rickettsiales bacterium Ac37b]|nr:hypothetical protein NOVO_00425 [Rickettsiales bacterium Ac37b]
MSTKLLIILMHLLIIIMSNRAYGYIEPSEMIRTWDDVKHLLRQRNIDYFTINLIEIDNYCASQIRSSDSIALNICRYETAVSTTLYNNDKKICTNNAEKEFPSSLVNNTNIPPMMTSIDVKGNITITYISVPIYDNKALEIDRNKSFQKCMQQLKWKNPYDWKNGQIE